MCFTPAVSLGTAVIEFGLIFWMRQKYPRAEFLKFGVWFMFLLGLYQFSEFLLCVAPHPDWWVRLGFIAYSFLPAVGLHAAFSLAHKKTRAPLLYLIPVLATGLILLPHVVLVSGACNTIFVTTHIFPPGFIGLIAFWVYAGLYYAGFIIWSCIVSVRAYLDKRNKRTRKLFLFMPVAVTLMTVPTMIFIIVMPYLDIRFPSVLCHFALLLALTIFLGIRYENQLNKKRI